jgi:hypothetical protein
MNSVVLHGDCHHAGLGSDRETQVAWLGCKNDSRHGKRRTESVGTRILETTSDDEAYAEHPSNGPHYGAHGLDRTWLRSYKKTA